MNKSRLISACIHLLLVALAIAGLTTVHTVEHQRYHETLVLPMDLPLPVAAPTSVMKPAVSSQPAASGARLSINAPALLRVNPESHEAAPLPVKLDVSDALALPQVAQRAVTAGLVARQVGFGQQGRVAGFGSGRGAGTVKLAAFTSNPAPSPVLATIAPTSLASKPVILSIPRARFTQAMRDEGVSGHVVVRVLLRADGVSEPVSVARSLGGDADAAALEVARHISFEVARDGSGQPVDCTVTLTVDLLVE
jgi:TonB family protein